MTTTQTQNKQIFRITPESTLDEFASLAELRAKRKEWLQEGIETGILADCRLVAIELGTRFEDELNYPWNEFPAFRWRCGDIEIKLFCDRGEKYLPLQRCFEELDYMHVFVNGHHVARYTFTNKEGADLSGCFYVPGKWTLIARGAGIEAANHEAARFFRVQDTERQALIDQLLVGVEV